MTCPRQQSGLPDNCAMCEALTIDLYNSCKGKSNNIKPKKEIIHKELLHEEAKKQVMDYIHAKGGKVQISEIAEKLKIDIEFVTEILEE